MTPRAFKAAVLRWQATLIRDVLVAIDRHDKDFIRLATKVYMEQGDVYRVRWVRTGSSTLERRSVVVSGKPPNPPPGPLMRRSGNLAGTVRGAPATFTGSIKSGVIRKAYLAGGTGVDYARIHEKGGIAGFGVTIPARPYMRPAAFDVMPLIRADVLVTIERAGQKVFGRGSH